MLKPAKMRKAVALLSHPLYLRSAMRHGVAAAIEHQRLVTHSAADTLIDIGANKGQFSLVFRAWRPEGRIIAFEPLPEAADVNERVFDGDARVELHRVALSDTESEAEFHVTDRRDSSSLLKPGAGQAVAFGVHDELSIRVPVRRLDTYLALAELAHPILIKIDVQGGELDVLRGCVDLEVADFIYVELSFVELYEKQPLFDETAHYLVGRGFTLAGVFNQSMTERFGPTQADFLFKRAG